jgi:hypothetical protein
MVMRKILVINKLRTGCLASSFVFLSNIQYSDWDATKGHADVIDL